MEESNRIREREEIITAIYNLQAWVGTEDKGILCAEARALLKNLNSVTSEQVLIEKMIKFLNEKGINVWVKEVTEF